MGRMMKAGAAIIGILVVIVLILSLFLVSGDRIHANITINGIDVGGMTAYEAEAKVRSVMEPILGKTLALRYEERNWPLTYKDLDLIFKYEEAAQKAYSIGHEGNFFQEVADSIRMQLSRSDIPLKYDYNAMHISRKLELIAGEIDQESVDATIRMEKGSFVITDEKIGRKLQQGRANDMIKEAVEKLADAEIQLPVEVSEPQVKRTDLENIKDNLGQYSTKFNAADIDRTHNVKLATNSANNVLLKPGEIYSLNKIVGPRLAKYGFKEAKVIINNELVPGIGGGVCQVSSTLYNAALLSNLKIIERRSHSLPSTYVPLGRDATISEDYIDFKFENTTTYPIYIYGEVKGSWVTFSIYGRNDHPGRSVRISTEIIKKTDPQIQVIEDPTLPAGTEVEEKKAYTGYVVKSYRIVTENGQQISKEELPLSVYRVAHGVKRVGTKKAPPAPYPQLTEPQPVLPETPVELPLESAPEESTGENR